MKNKFHFFSTLTIVFTIAFFQSCNTSVDLPNNFSTKVKDIDGNEYSTVTIGSQVWMVENLKVTRYNNGDPINLVTDATSWSKLSTGAYCNYDNDISTGNIYGRLYNWYAVKTGVIAPKGWHVPTDAEWTILKNYMIANKYNYDGTTTNNKIAKSLASKDKWEYSTIIGAIGNNMLNNNLSGFSAMPGGTREGNGLFNEIYKHGYWWSTIDQNDVDNFAGGMNLYHDWIYITTLGAPKNHGCSIRCIKD